MPVRTSPFSRRKSDPEERHDKKWYVTRTYSDTQIRIIFDFARSINFEGTDVIRFNESKDEEIDFLCNALLSNEYRRNPKAVEQKIAKRIDSAKLPYAAGKLVRRCFFNWDFLEKNKNKSLNEIHKDFLEQLNALFYYVKHNALAQSESSSKSLDNGVEAKYTQNKLERAIDRLFLDEEEYAKNIDNNAELIHLFEIAFIHFISELTANGHENKARLIHEFISINKVMILASTETNVLAARLLGSALSAGLKLQIEDGAPFQHFMSGLITLTMRNHLFDQPYDKDTYLIYYHLNEQCKLNGISSGNTFQVLGLPNSIIKDEANLNLYEIIARFISKRAVRKADIDELLINLSAFTKADFNSKDKEELTKEVVIYYFEHLVEAHLNKNNEVAENIFNVIVHLRQLYKDSENKPNNLKYGRILRLATSLPSISSENDKVDRLFDTIAASAVLGSVNRFKDSYQTFRMVQHITERSAQVEEEKGIKQAEVEQKLKQSPPKSTLTFEKVLVRSSSSHMRAPHSPPRALLRSLTGLEEKGSLESIDEEDEDSSQELETIISNSPPKSKAKQLHFRKNFKSTTRGSRNSPSPSPSPSSALDKTSANAVQEQALKSLQQELEDLWLGIDEDQPKMEQEPRSDSPPKMFSLENHVEEETRANSPPKEKVTDKIKNVFRPLFHKKEKEEKQDSRMLDNTRRTKSEMEIKSRKRK